MDSDDGGTTEGGSSMTSSTMTTQGGSTTASTSDPSTSSGAPTSEESSTTIEPVVCQESQVCVTAAPEGWSGPIVVAATPVGMEPTCAGDYPEAALSAFDQLVAPPANCECDCGDVEGASCENPTLEYHADDAACASANDEWTVTTGCVAVSAPGADRWQLEAPPVDNGDCTAIVVADDVPESSWDTAITTCTGPFNGLGCDEGSLCVRVPEPPFEAALCIWHEDAISCPEGEYQERRIYYTEVSDTRSCGECTCGDPVGTCDGYVRLYSDTSCMNPVNTVTANGTCQLQGNGTGVARARWYPGEMTAACEPSEGAPMGLATGAGERTVCCRAV